MGKTVFYWRGITEIRRELISAFFARGFEVVGVRTIDEMLDLFDASPPVLLLVDCSGGEREASERVIELSNCPKLYEVPLIFLAAQAKKRADALEGSFLSILPVFPPYRADVILAGAEVLARNPKAAEDALAAMDQSQSGLAAGEKDKAEETSPASDTPEQAGFDTAAEAPADETRPVRKLLPENTEAIKRRMRKYPDPTRIEGSFGGEVFAVARDASNFNDTYLVPALNGGKSAAELLDGLAAQDPWLAANAKRSAFVSCAIGHGLSCDQQRSRDLRAAAILLNWTLRSQPEQLVRHDFFAGDAPERNAELGELLRQGAETAEIEFQEKRAARLLRVVSEILKGNKVNADADVLQDAEILLGVEAAARSCWGLNHWHPWGAYRVIRHLRSSASLITQPQVNRALVSMLGEAVTAHVTVGSLFVPGLVDDEDVDAAAAAKKRLSLANEGAALAAARADSHGVSSRAVPVKQLCPGMLLMAPLVAKDGRLILDANIVLNEQLVFDIWQLAAVRALCDSVEVAEL